MFGRLPPVSFICAPRGSFSGPLDASAHSSAPAWHTRYERIKTVAWTFIVAAPVTDIQAINDLAAGDMDAVNRCIGDRLHSEVELVNQLSGYIVNSGGKRLRPLLVLLSARACGFDGNGLPLKRYSQIGWRTSFLLRPRQDAWPSHHCRR